MYRLIAFLLLTGLAAPVVAAGDAEAGEAKSGACVACHGPAGISPNPDWPNLAGQQEGYLLTTPLQLATAYSIFANDGVLVPPFLVEGERVPASRRVLSPEVARTVRVMTVLVIVGWTIYPLGFFVTLLGDGASAGLMRELIYNVADVVNKVGFCMLAVSAAKAASYVRVAEGEAAA